MTLPFRSAIGVAVLLATLGAGPLHAAEAQPAGSTLRMRQKSPTR